MPSKSKPYKIYFDVNKKDFDELTSLVNLIQTKEKNLSRSELYSRIIMQGLRAEAAGKLITDEGVKKVIKDSLGLFLKEWSDYLIDDNIASFETVNLLRLLTPVVWEKLMGKKLDIQTLENNLYNPETVLIKHANKNTEKFMERIKDKSEG